MNSMLALVLGGGAGTRLYPLTKPRAKPAVPLAGKYRLVDVPVSNCINSEVNRIFVLTQFNSASLNRHIARAYRFDRFGAGFVTIIAAEQTPSSKDWFQGTADAVRRTLPHLDSHRHDQTLILSGDQLYAMDYRKLLRHHKENDAAVTLATIPVTADDAPAFGILKTDDENHITEFHEKPPREKLDGKESPVSPAMQEQGRIYLASMGIYLFDREVLSEMLRAHPDDHDFGGEIIPRAIRERRVVSYPFEDYWSDIGTIQSFYDANLMLGQPQPPFSIYSPDQPLYTNARMLPPAKIQDAHTRHSLISEGSVLTDCELTESVVGIRSYIERGATVKNTVFMGTDFYPWQPPTSRRVTEGPPQAGIGEDSHVENAIIDKNVSIGKHCRIENREGVEEAEGENYQIRDGIVVIPKNTRIPDGTVI
ncbi:MAG: glucose-1-phosphate adenylyltransferase [Bacteroidetes bacterium QH_9_67_14]|jgi:glucose-1-phosphate adenylyltransferase|nr:MAG: glucose-1-phosphate adenylyltransferase [Bacteroidetes bacterium QH_9_67_14]